MMSSSPSFEVLQRKTQVETMSKPGDNGRNALLDYLAKRLIPAVSIAVINDYRIEWAAGYGVCESGQSDSITTETLFQACSMSKTVTAVAALRLVEQGKLDLDANVNAFLTSWQLPSQGSWQPHVTLRQLLSHTAGTSPAWYPGYHRDQDIPTLLEILESDQPSNTPGVRVTGIPGLRFCYSGGGYCVVQQILMDVMQKSFPELMRELIFEPLEMHHSTYEQPLPAEKWGSAATGHRAGGKPVPGKWHIHPEMAAAGLWTTPSDVARFALDLQFTKAGMPGQLLSPQMVNKLLTPQCNAGNRGDIGLGVFMHGTANQARFGHAGDNTGFNCQWVSLVNQGQGYVIMTNSDEGWRIVEKLEHVIARVYELPDIPSPDNHHNGQDSAIYDEYVGAYELRPNFLLTIMKADNGLLLQAPQQAPIALVRVDDMVYVLANLEDSITFLKNEQGMIDMLILQQEASQVVARRRTTAQTS
ncbi:MAG: serine hydrolase domain-containing protein [Ktedonobacteraceae bacterium]